jgi:hypothetical protein
MLGWIPVRNFECGNTTLWLAADGSIQPELVVECRNTDNFDEVYHINLDKGHVFVAGGLAAHNMKEVVV